MGRTLFWYIFRDLLKIFLMANGALAGIMSFGGLLRPLTHQGLDAGQVAKLLGYFNMAMLTYSLPIAALFATTVVYGRLSADNELTACRAGGMSHLAVTLPAFVLGILVAILSLVFLCFIVPIYTFKAEQTLYSNFSRLIASSIQRTHQIAFGGATIFAQDAYIPPNSGKDGTQIVVLKGPTIQTMIRPDKDDPTYRVPKDFYTASEATIFIEQQEKGQQRGTGKMYLRVMLTDGMKFPRQFEGAMEAGVAETSYGPMEVDSPIREDTKFMNVWLLKELYHDPTQSAKVKGVLTGLIQRDQGAYLADRIQAELNGPTGEAHIRLSDGEIEVLKRAKDSPPAQSANGEVTLPASPPSAEMSLWLATQASADSLSALAGVPLALPMPMPRQADYRPITFQQWIPGHSTPVYTARAAHLHARPTEDGDMMKVSLELADVLRTSPGDSPVIKRSEPFSFELPLPAAARRIAQRDYGFYTRPESVKLDRQRVGREVFLVTNQVLAESNNRVSFAISCLVLVMVGTALGLMFKSGNYLTAFAISFIPALLTITLIVAGQRVSGSLPEVMQVDVRAFVNKPLHTGLTLIWLGNCVNFLLAVVLLGRLQRQ